MGLLALAADAFHGASERADVASHTFILVYGVGKQVHTDLGGALFLDNMRLIFISKVAQGGDHGIGGGLTEAAQGALIDVLSQLLQTLDVFRLALALGDAVE